MTRSNRMKFRLNHLIGHFTVMDESETEGDLVLIQTFLIYYVNQVILMLNSIFQEKFSQQSKEGLYQNKVTLSLASIHNCKMKYFRTEAHAINSAVWPVPYPCPHHITRAVAAMDSFFCPYWGSSVWQPLGQRPFTAEASTNQQS